jgi:hypothetical protein
MLKAAFGEEKIFSKPELKSPAEIEKLGEDAANTVKGLAYTPQTGLTVALSTDKRPEVAPPKPEAFTDFLTGDNTGSKQV